MDWTMIVKKGMSVEEVLKELLSYDKRGQYYFMDPNVTPPVVYEARKMSVEDIEAAIEHRTWILFTLESKK